ncbi:hypothetical protein [Fimbriiglobus ruber]|uniref:Uncharacterized protein n=1 Tax=Fimbriiglobus ruber TaxID=1908690 RepID=A0A225E4U2_9BACT|nr:hypothetical protein [Fimbriiglobus ruber]OWK44509.1 hypothetical protein FRUB_02441 [Fimbriiglobus ruber]
MIEAGRLAEAKTATGKAIADEPTLENAYLSRLTIALKEKNHADASAWIKKGAEAAGLQSDLDAAKDDPDWADFLKSPECAKVKVWLAGQKK